MRRQVRRGDDATAHDEIIGLSALRGIQLESIEFYAGPKAIAQLRAHGVRSQDIVVIPAAAGGPKGLILQALDQWLFGSWLPGAARKRSLIGASIGAWRMAAACHADPVAAFQRLATFIAGSATRVSRRRNW